MDQLANVLHEKVLVIKLFPNLYVGKFPLPPIEFLSLTTAARQIPLQRTAILSKCTQVVQRFCCNAISKTIHFAKDGQFDGLSERITRPNK
jgi:hypothetical protein